jgi:hypothetical protein
VCSSDLPSDSVSAATTGTTGASGTEETDVSVGTDGGTCVATEPAAGAVADGVGAGGAFAPVVSVTITGTVGRGNSTGVNSTTPPVSKSAKKNRLSITTSGVEGRWLRHRIEPAGPEGMATRDALHREPAATQRSVLLERFNGVVGTRGMITTRSGQEWR